LLIKRAISLGRRLPERTHFMTNPERFNSPLATRVRGEVVPALFSVGTGGVLAADSNWTHAWHHAETGEAFPRWNLAGNLTRKVPFIASRRRPDYAGYSSSGCACPRCNGATLRVPRRLVDLLLSMFVSVSRYRCESADCRWKGNLRVKRRSPLIRGPW
jgi:hypothetical protein